MTDKKHKCHKCGHSFMDSTHLNRHLNNSSDCVSKVKLENIRNHICKGCNCSFSRKDSLDRHLKTCKEFNSINNKSDIEVCINVNNINNSDIAININTNNNKKSDIAADTNVNNNHVNDILPPVTQKNVLRIPHFQIRNIFNGDLLETIVVKVIFCPDISKYHNIVFKNANDHCMIHDGKNWDKKSIVHVMESLCGADNTNVLDNIQEIHFYLPADYNDHLKPFLDQIKNIFKP